MSGLDISIKENKYQLYGLVTLRVLIGWHFLYEGIAKLINPYWSSAAYLLDSKWIFSILFHFGEQKPYRISHCSRIGMK